MGCVCGRTICQLRESCLLCENFLSRRNSMKKITNNCCFVLVKLSLAEEDIDRCGKAL